MPAALHPYLGYRSTGRPGAAPPAKVEQLLRRALRASQVIELGRRAACREILTALTEATVPTIVLKGAALGHLVYPDPALRPMQDIDLWIPLDRLEQAVQALLAIGYRLPERKYRGQSDLGVPERALELPGTPILVELQGAPPSLADLGPAFAERCWRRAVETPLGGIHARVLHPEDLLIHICLHALGHHRLETGLLPLLDLRLVIERFEREWGWTEMARDYTSLGIASRMYLMLDLVRHGLDAPVPDALFQALGAPPELDQMRALAWEQIWAPPAQLPRALERGLGETSLAARVGWLRRRFTTHYAADLPGPAWHWGSALEIGRRVAHDLGVKVPRYVRGWVRGDLRGGELKRRAALARGRGRLSELLDQAETGRTEQERSGAV